MPLINRKIRKPPRVPTTKKGEYQEIYQRAAWKSLVKWKKSQNPFCEACKAKGRATPTEEIHHVIPFQLGRNESEILALAYDPDNIEALCIPCHKERHKKSPEMFHRALVAYFTRSYL